MIRRSFLAQLLAAPLAFVAAWKAKRAPVVLEDARLWINGEEIVRGEWFSNGMVIELTDDEAEMDHATMYVESYDIASDTAVLRPATRNN